LQRKPDEWRNLQTEKKKLSDAKVEASASPTPKESSGDLFSVAESTPSRPKKKRKRQEDEIDALFSSFSGKKIKKEAVDSKPTNNNLNSRRGFVSADGDLQKIFSAIQAAPRGERSKSKQRKSKQRKSS